MNFESFFRVLVAFLVAVSFCLYPMGNSRHHNYVMQDDFMNRMKAIQSERNALIRNVCQSDKKIFASFPIEDRHFKNFDLKHKLLYCENSKAGTTTWKSYLYALLNISRDVQNLKLMEIHDPVDFVLSRMRKDLSLQEMREMSRRQDFLTFSFVRHPYDRLASSFKNRIEKKEIGGKLNKSFPNFVQKIIDERTKCKSDPTFVQPFEGYCDWNKHWAPYQETCNFCQMDYDFVGKLETFHEDTEYIFRLLGSWDFIRRQVGFLRMHQSKEKIDNITRKLFAQLSQDLKDQLYKVYEADFQMFDYDPLMYY